MPFLSNPHHDLIHEHMDTARCFLLPFSVDGRVDIRELAEEFCKANKDKYISQLMPNYDEEMDFVINVVESMKRGEVFENFIFERESLRFIGCAGLNRMEDDTMNIGIWIRSDEHGKGYATEVYEAIIVWAKRYTPYTYLKHYVHPDNVASHKLALKFGGIKQSYTNERGDVFYHIPIR